MASKANLDVAEKLDITCRKGDTFELQLNLKDSSGNALPLVTDKYDFLMQVRGGRRRQGQKGALVAGTTTKGQQALSKDGSTPIGFSFQEADDLGNVKVFASASTMEKFEAGRYNYDLQYIVNEKTTTILKGSFNVNDDISTTS